MAPHNLTAPPARRRALVAALLLAATALAQTPRPHLADPANLTGEQVAPQSLADTLPINHGAPALAQLLKKLRTRASLMMIVAHPDDEDGGMLTYESRGQGARVAMLTLTRGEGGQNLMSADFNDALGLIRTQELLAADRFFGTDQFFGSEVDFGFSKTREETLAQWTHDRVLYDAVRAVRLYRPLVLTSVFIGGVTDGHGHHQVAGQMNQEVFEAAADPKVFPEMGLPAWAPLKVYARVPFARVTRDAMYDYATGKSTTPRFYNYVTRQWTTEAPTATVRIPEGDVSPAPGMDGLSYIQFARKGLALQKTQIGANVRLAPAGAFDAPYTRYASRIPTKETESSFFDGIDVSLPGIATLAPAAPATLRTTLQAIDDAIAKAQQLFTPDRPEATAPSLRDALKALDTVIANTQTGTIPPGQKFNVLHELRIKRVQCNNALVLALGIEANATLASRADSGAPLTPGSTYAVHLEVVNRGTRNLAIESAALDLRAGKSSAALPNTSQKPGSILAPGTQYTLAWKTELLPNTPPTEPYFHRAGMEQATYEIEDPALRNAPQTPDPLVATMTLLDEGVPLHIAQTVQDPSPSSLPRAAVIVPRLSVAITPGVGIVSTEAADRIPFPFAIDVRTNVLSVNRPRIDLVAPPNFKVTVPRDDFTLTSIDDTHTLNATLVAHGMGPGAGLEGPPPIKAVAVDPLPGGKPVEISIGYRTVGYSGLTPTNFYRPAELRIVGVDVSTAPGLKVAYLPGTGDDVAMYLSNLGITPTVITAQDLTPASLNQYDAVLLGVRAYAAHPELTTSTALLSYAAAGGVVIVQYNTARYGDPQSPYPIEVPGDSAHNVVVEAQPVTILAPDSPVLNWPNHITSADFKGWTEELGHGFAASWDPKFEPLTETHDPGQDPQRGGLLYARTGRGAYLYVAYALYRQLPEGVPGAYRIMANLLSLPRNPKAGLQPIAK